MKTRLPKMLLAALLAAVCVSNVQARLYSTGGQIIITKEDNANPDKDCTLDSSTLEYVKYTPLVKDGDGTLELKAGDMKAPFFIREGAVEVKTGTTVNLYGATPTIPHPSKPDTFLVDGLIQHDGNQVLNVAGKEGTTLHLNGGTINVKREQSISVGGADGSGKVVLDNKAKLNGNVSFFIGYSGYLDATDPAQVGFVNGHATTTKVGASAANVANRFEGDYKDGFGYGEVEVKGKSTLYTGYTNLVVNHGRLDISDNSTVTCGKHHWSAGGIIGQQDNAQAVVNISSGGKLIIEGDLVTARGNNSSATISVDNGSFCVADIDGNGAHDSYYISKLGANADLQGSTTITATNNATIHLANAVMGAKNGQSTVNVTIDSTSNYKGNSLEINDSATFTNSGNMTVEELTLCGGSLTIQNGGTLTVTGALTFHITQFPTTQSVGMLSAVSGDTTPVLTLESGSNLDVDFNSIDLNLIYSDEVLAEVNKLAKLGSEGHETTSPLYELTFDVRNLVAGADDDLASALAAEIENTVTHELISGWGDDYVAVVGAADNKNGSVTITFQHVPEPATATLSLLALAGLAARRRRR